MKNKIKTATFFFFSKEKELNIVVNETLINVTGFLADENGIYKAVIGEKTQKALVEAIIENLSN